MLPQAPNLGRGLAYIAEPAITIGSSLLSEVPAGWGGMLTGDPSNVEKIHHAGTYIPRTESGRQGLADLGGFLSNAGAAAMDMPYLGQSIRYFGESADKLGAHSPVLGAALKTAPAAAALLFPGGEGALAAREVGSTIAKNAAQALSKPGPVGLARQRGFINPSAMIPSVRKTFEFTRAGKSTAAALASERAAQRIGSGLERTHQGYVAEKTAGQNGEHEGRNLLAH